MWIDDQKRLTYSEKLIDRSLGDKTVLDQSSLCQLDGQASTTAASAPTAAATGKLDAVGIELFGGARAYVQVGVGSQQMGMLIDTGASSMLIGPTMAQKLVNAGEAEIADRPLSKLPTARRRIDGSSSFMTCASGRTPSMTSRRSVNGDDDADNLLGFPVLNHMGRFTIDTVSNLLIFG